MSDGRCLRASRSRQFVADGVSQPALTGDRVLTYTTLRSRTHGRTAIRDPMTPDAPAGTL